MKTVKWIWEWILRFAGFLAALWKKRQHFNSWMAKRYTPAAMALIGTAVCLAVAVFSLFTPAYLGLSLIHI